MSKRHLPGFTRLIGEAALFGALCVGTVWLVARLQARPFGWDDWRILLPTFFFGGAVIYFFGEQAGGRFAGASAGAVAGLIAAGLLASNLPGGQRLPFAEGSLALGCVVGAALGAWLQNRFVPRESTSSADGAHQ